MRDLTFRLSKKDILRMVMGAGHKKNGRREWAILAALFLLVLFSCAYTILRAFLTGSQVSLLWQLGSVFGSLMLLFGISLAAALLLKAVQYIKLIKSPLMQTQLVQFKEHRIEVRHENGKVSCYPYAAILDVDKTGHQIVVYMKGIENAKTFLILPASAFTGAGEMDFCTDFLQNMQKEEGNMDLLKQQAEVTSLQEEVFTFAFIQGKTEWMDALTTGKYYLLHSKYVLKTVEGIISLIMFLFTFGFAVSSLYRDWNIIALISSVIVFILIFGFIYQIYFSRRGILRRVRVLEKNRELFPDRTGRQVVTFENSEFGYCSEGEQWKIKYEQAAVVRETSREVFIFTKGLHFLNIPVWVFRSEEEKQQLLDYLRGKGIPVIYKDI